MRLLLVEDEEELSMVVAKGLRKCGYAVDIAYDGEEALYLFHLYEYDLMILDLNLPIVDGITVLAEVRKENDQIKVLILSARSEIEDRVLGLDEGANDYLIKPFDFMELNARIRALLRIAFVQKDVVLSCAKLSIDTNARTASYDEVSFALTPKEYGILEYLMIHKGTVISAEQLIEHVWDSDVDLFSNSLKFHIHSIKKKLSALGSGDQLIRNLRGQGYILTEADYETNSSIQ